MQLLVHCAVADAGQEQAFQQDYNIIRQIWQNNMGYKHVLIYKVNGNTKAE